MNDILLSLGLAGVFFGAMAFRGIFGYLKNQQISLDKLRFNWKTFLRGSIRPIALTLAVGALVALILAFLELLGVSGLEVVGLEQISASNIELGLAIADVGAIAYAMKEALLCFGLTDKQVNQIRQTILDTEDGQATGIKIDLDDEGEVMAYADAITPDHLLEDKPADEGSEKQAAEQLEKIKEVKEVVNG